MVWVDFTSETPVLDVGSYPIGVSTPTVTVTIPLRVDLGDVPPDLVLPDQGDWPRLSLGALFPYVGGNPVLDATFAAAGIGPGASVRSLLNAFGFARLSFRLRDVSLQGGAASDFTGDVGDCVGSAGASCTTGPLAFTPKAAGVRSDIVTVSIGDIKIDGSGAWASLANIVAPYFIPMVAERLRFEVRGFGLSLRPTTLLLDHGTIPEGTIAAPASLSVDNMDFNAVNPEVSIEGEHPADFSIVAPAGPIPPLLPGAALPVDVVFQPKGRGVRTASLRIACDTPGSPVVVPMVGFAIGPMVTLSPSSIAFDDTPTQTVSQPKMVAVTNIGDGPLIVTSVTLTGQAVNSFAIVQETCTQGPINVGETRVVAVAFRPMALGAVTASVVLNDNADDAPQRVSLVGVGTPSANLAVGISCAPTAHPGDQITYEIVVYNEGPGTAVEVVVSQDLPSNATFVSADRPVLAPLAGATGGLDCRLGELLPGASATLHTTVEVVAAAGGTVATSAFVVSGTPDPYPHTKSADFVVRVVP